MKLYIKQVGICFLLGVLAVASYAQQMPQYAQYMFNPLAINPAYAGAEEALTMTLLVRSQWHGIDGAPSTQTLSAHGLLAKQQLGLGLQIVHDQVGVHNNLNVTLPVAYQLKTGKKSFLAFGAQAILTNQRTDYASLQTSGVADPALMNSVNKTYMDVGFGLFYKSPKFQAGFSAAQLRAVSYNTNDTTTLHFSNATYFGFARYTIDINNDWQVEPGILLSYSPDLPRAYNLNANLIYKKVLSLGFSYRSEQSLTTLLSARLTPQLFFGYSYDYGFGGALTPRSGSHELMVKYQFRYQYHNVSSPRQ